jgi:homoserine O-acetyltransferase
MELTDLASAPLATGAWQPGDPPGRRRFAELYVDRPRALEAGGTLGAVTVAFETWGRPSPARDNAVLVAHALTGDSHVVGVVEPGHPTPGWWDPLIGPGRPIDTDRWWVVCSNVLGGCQGTTGPSSVGSDACHYGPRFPTITVRDQVDVEAALADHLGIGRWAAVVGGSMGGMRVLEWAVGRPERLARAIVLACGAAASAEQIALCAVQAEAIRADPGWCGGDYYDRPAGEGPHRGLGLARRIGHVSYRSEGELAARFGRLPQGDEEPLGGGRYAVESYLDHHAAKLIGRFDANSYLVLSRAMDHHDVGRGRGGLAAALGGVTADTTVIGIDSDRLYPLRLQAELVALLAARPPLQVVHSSVGHDGFLLEMAQIGPVIRAALAR